MKKTFHILLLVILAAGCAGENGKEADDAVKEKIEEYLYAAKDGDLAEVKKMLSAGVDVNSRGEEGNTALHIAMIEENLELLKLLAKRGADLNLKDASGEAPLHKAVRISAIFSERDEMVEFMLSKGANPNVRDSKGNTPLHLAVSENLLMATALIDKFLDNGADVNAKNSDGKTPSDLVEDGGIPNVLAHLRKRGGKLTITPGDIIEAAKYGDIAGVREFLKAGANVNSKDDYEKTALHYAAEHGELELAELLLAHGADLEAKECGSTPLHLAVDMGNKKMVKLLLGRGADVEANYRIGSDMWYKPIHLGADGGHAEILGMLLDSGAEIEMPNSWGETPLHLAIKGRREEAAKLLIRRGANTKKKSGTNVNTPLHVAAKMGLAEIVRLIVAGECDVNAKNIDGNTPLHCAAKGHVKYSGLLELDAVGKPAQPGSEQTASLLLDNGAVINAKNNWGGTPLHQAVAGWNREVIKLLLDQGVQLNATDKYGHTPLDEAESPDYKKLDAGIAELLKSYGALSGKDLANERDK